MEMLESMSPLTQTLLGTAFTWSMTALGAIGCLLHYSKFESRKLLDASLGFSAGVMLAASYWSLLSPAEEMAIASGYGVFSFVPLATGVMFGALFVLLADKYAPITLFTAEVSNPKNKITLEESCKRISTIQAHDSDLKIRQRNLNGMVTGSCNDDHRGTNVPSSVSKRLLLMMIAITMHNIPEGLAVGIAFGAAGQTRSATVSKARNLALGIGIQNLPEGLAVSLPLKAAGMSFSRSIWYGQLSGLVEPIAGAFGCLAVQLISPILPYALAFAAGAMIFVVFDDIMPETQQMGNGQLASVSAVFGFLLMMCLDIGLG